MKVILKISVTTIKSNENKFPYKTYFSDYILKILLYCFLNYLKYCDKIER